MYTGFVSMLHSRFNKMMILAFRLLICIFVHLCICIFLYFGLKPLQLPRAFFRLAFLYHLIWILDLISLTFRRMVSKDFASKQVHMVCYLLDTCKIIIYFAPLFTKHLPHPQIIAQYMQFSKAFVQFPYVFHKKFKGKQSELGKEI